MKSKERCRGYGKFSYNVFFPLKLLRATGEVGKEVKENCGNIKSLRYLRIFFFSSLWSVFRLWKFDFTFWEWDHRGECWGWCWAEGLLSCQHSSLPNQLIGYVPLEAPRWGWMYSSAGSCHCKHATCVNHIYTPSFRGSPLSSADIALPKQNSPVVSSTSSAALRDTQKLNRPSPVFELITCVCLA